MTLHGRLVGLDVARCLALLGMVNAVPEFEDHPKVINGCSDLFVEVLGSRGKHARSAVGMGSLPMGIPVEIECIVEVGGGILMILGALTQLVAVAFAVIMIGAIFLKNTQWKTGFMAQQTTGWEFDLVLLAANILLFFTGPGEIAIQT
jgi:uncharacterized membrane protein YphA (DoxX/SURF4 family)